MKACSLQFLQVNPALFVLLLGRHLHNAKYLHVLNIIIMKLLRVIISPGEGQVNDQSNLHSASHMTFPSQMSSYKGFNLRVALEIVGGF